VWCGVYGVTVWDICCMVVVCNEMLDHGVLWESGRAERKML
jgi:hypothetical protein